MALLAASLGAGIALPATAQDIEPRAYSNAPIGVNFLISGYAYTRGGVSVDPTVPLTNANLHTSNAVVGYARVLDLWGQSGKVDVIVPYTWLSGTAEFNGEPAQRVVNGFANPAVRISWNFHGSPSLTLKDFVGWEQDLIVGASLRVSAPWSQYDADRLVNIGTNRWSFKPELGISKSVGPWTLEMAAAATIFTDNPDFYGGVRRSQDPLYSVQAHLIHGFKGGSWASLDATYFAGGRSTVNGAEKSDLQQNWRLGGTFAYPLDRANSIKFYLSSGVSARTDNNFDLVGVAWQYRWGGGL
jgi:hypothetical protein